MKRNLYTVDDVAEMTGLTTRTIHNYIRNGKLQGKKLGVQWRFTEENIDALFQDKKVEEGITDLTNNIIFDFLKQTERQITEVCTVIDFVSQDKSTVEDLIEKLVEFVNSNQETGITKFSYQYLKTQKVARFIVRGKLNQVNEINNIINDYEVKG